MGWRRLDLAVLALGVLSEFGFGIALGRGGAVAASVMVLVALASGATLGGPLRAAIFTLIAAFVLSPWLVSIIPFSAGAVVAAAAAAVVVRRRPAMSRAVSRVTTGTPLPRPIVPMWALVIAPLAAAAAFWLAQRFLAPGAVLGLSGSPRHLANGLGAIALVLIAATLVAWRARAASVPRTQAAGWALVAAGMVLFWALAIFLLLYLITGPPGG